MAECVTLRARGVNWSFSGFSDPAETIARLHVEGATLDPLAARRPEGGLFMWSEQQEGSGFVTSGNPNFNNSSAAALLSYDVAHSIPWDWRVSLYTWTKGIASGVYFVACLLVLLGVLDVNNSIWLWATPIVSGGFLAITGGLLIWDLEHPERLSRSCAAAPEHRQRPHH